MLLNRLLNYIVLLVSIAICQAQSNDRALAVGDSLFAVGNYSNAIQYYKNSQLPNHFKIAKAEEALGQYAQALESYNRMLKNDPDNVLGLLSYSKLLVETNHFKKGDSLLLNLVSKNRDNPNIAYQLGLSKQQQNDSTAIAFFLLAHRINPDFINATYQAAKHFVVKRQFGKASPLISGVLEKDSENIKFLNLKALLHFHQKEYQEAILVYKKLQKLGEYTQQLFENLAVAYDKTRQHNESIEVYKELLNHFDTRNAAWHFELGRAYYFERDIEKAQEHFKIALLLLDQPLDMQYLHFAMTYFEQKDYKKAIEFLKIAIEENPENQLAHYKLAVAKDNYYEDKEAVLKVYQKYLDTFKEKTTYDILVENRMRDIRRELHFQDVGDDN